MSERSDRATPSEEPRVVIRDRRKIDPVTGTAREPQAKAEAKTGAGEVPAPAAAAGAGTGADSAVAKESRESAEVEALRRQVSERTADLQRVTAEYANYRKRVERDRSMVAEIATGLVLGALLPVLDDIERARQHGDLTGAFKAVADQLETTLEKLGLQPFGVAGDSFDPMVHEAVAHETSPDVTEPTCVSVLRRGYRQGERLLRAALVAVADPAPEPAPAAEPTAPSDLPGPELPGPELPGPEPAGAELAGAELAGAVELGEDGTPVEWFGQDGPDGELDESGEPDEQSPAEPPGRDDDPS
jgi:molecular chaperone GrpE